MGMKYVQFVWFNSSPKIMAYECLHLFSMEELRMDISTKIWILLRRYSWDFFFVELYEIFGKFHEDFWKFYDGFGGFYEDFMIFLWWISEIFTTVLHSFYDKFCRIFMKFLGNLMTIFGSFMTVFGNFMPNFGNFMTFLD